MLRDQLRVGANERVVRARFPAEPFDGRNGVRDGVVLVAISDVSPREHLLAGGRRLVAPNRSDDYGDNRSDDGDTGDQLLLYVGSGFSRTVTVRLKADTTYLGG